MITCHSNNNGKLVAVLDAATLHEYGMNRPRCAHITFHTNGALDDYPDWFEIYPSRVDRVLQDAEAAIRNQFRRVIECCSHTSASSLSPLR